MSISYDPMTGEPIETTDEPIVTENMEEVPQQITGYDPETGEPIYGAAAPEQVTGYDAETGEPIYGEVQESNALVYNEPAGDFPNGTTPKKKFPAWILVVAAIAVLVVVLVAVVVKAFGGGTNAKIAAAVVKTCEQGPLAKELQFTELIKGGTYTLGAGVKLERVDVDYCEAFEGMIADGQLAVNMDKNIYGVNGTFQWDEYDLDLSLESYLDKNELAVAVPQLVERTFVYNFTEEKDGFLVDYAGDEAIELIDTMMQWVMSRDNTKSNEKMATEITKVLANAMKSWEFTSGKEKDFEVNGKKRSCKAYTITVTDDMILDILDPIMDLYSEYYSAQQKELEELFDELDEDLADELDEMDIKALYKELKHELKDMPETEVTFYLYKDQMASVLVDFDELKCSAEFLIKGGDYPMQNWELVLEVEGYDFSVEKTGKVKGSVEQNELEIDGLNADLEWTYDSKSGDVTVDMKYPDEDITVSMEGNVKRSSDELMIRVDNMSIDDDYWEEGVEFSGYVSISSKASISKPSYETFDLGNADEDEYEDIAEEVEDVLMDMLY